MEPTGLIDRNDAAVGGGRSPRTCLFSGHVDPLSCLFDINERCRLPDGEHWPWNSKRNPSLFQRHGLVGSGLFHVETRRPQIHASIGLKAAFVCTNGRRKIGAIVRVEDVKLER